MSLPALDNLVKIRQLKAESPDVAEIGRLIQMAQTRLADARLSSVSLDSLLKRAQEESAADSPPSSNQRKLSALL
jgi:hypothetical protein